MPDIPETGPGFPVIGWDTCVGGEMLSSRIECVACPASRGSEFLVVDGTLTEDIDSLKPQLYFYFDPPQGAEALWFDVAWLSGPRYAELSFWETNMVCEPLSEQRLFDLSALLDGDFGAWSSACIPLDGTRALQGVGMRLGAAGRIGLDAVRFGGRCRGE